MATSFLCFLASVVVQSLRTDELRRRGEPRDLPTPSRGESRSQSCCRTPRTQGPWSSRFRSPPPVRLRAALRPRPRRRLCFSLRNIERMFWIVATLPMRIHVQPSRGWVVQVGPQWAWDGVVRVGVDAEWVELRADAGRAELRPRFWLPQ